MSYFNESEIIKLYQLGNSCGQIAKQFNTYSTSIRRVLIRNNIKLRTVSQSLATVKNNPFTDLTNQNVNYWLGYLIADGYIETKGNDINITTSDKDIEHLKKYINFLNVDISINTYLHSKFKVNCNRVTFGNKEIKSYLVNLGITPNKSMTVDLKIPMNWNILRGIIDGDGCFKLVNKQYSHKGYYIAEIATSSEKLKGSIISFLEANNIKCNYSTIIKKNILYLITIGKKSEVKKLINNLYKNADTFLDRKYLKVRHLIEESISKTP